MNEVTRNWLQDDLVPLFINFDLNSRAFLNIEFRRIEEGITICPLAVAVVSI